jgi:hypothetical protein
VSPELPWRAALGDSEVLVATRSSWRYPSHVRLNAARRLPRGKSTQLVAVHKVPSPAVGAAGPNCLLANPVCPSQLGAISGRAS